jgi:hypothetical protein
MVTDGKVMLTPSFTRKAYVTTITKRDTAVSTRIANSFMSIIQKLFASPDAIICLAHLLFAIFILILTTDISNPVFLAEVTLVQTLSNVVQTRDQLNLPIIALSKTAETPPVIHTAPILPDEI